MTGIALRGHSYRRASVTPSFFVRLSLLLLLAAVAFGCTPEVSLGSFATPTQHDGAAGDDGSREPSNDASLAPDATTDPGDAGSTDAGGDGSAPIDCFSPVRNLASAYDGDAIGCPCTGPSRICLRLGRPEWLALECVDGRWAGRFDETCGEAPFASCVVNDVIYAHGSPVIESPYDCNFCLCADGYLGCSRLSCPGRCAPGTVPGTECLACGPDGSCALRRSACQKPCVRDEDCTDPQHPRCDVPRGYCTDELDCRG